MRALEELRAIPHEKRLLNADVDEDLVASIVGDWTGIPVGRMVQDDVRAIVELEPEAACSACAGGDGALEVIGRELRAPRSGLKTGGAAARRLSARRSERGWQDGRRPSAWPISSSAGSASS